MRDTWGRTSLLLRWWAEANGCHTIYSLFFMLRWKRENHQLGLNMNTASRVSAVDVTPCQVRPGEGSSPLVVSYVNGGSTFCRDPPLSSFFSCLHLPHEACLPHFLSELEQRRLSLSFSFVPYISAHSAAETLLCVDVLHYQSFVLSEAELWNLRVEAWPSIPLFYWKSGTNWGLS